MRVLPVSVKQSMVDSEGRARNIIQYNNSFNTTKAGSRWIKSNSAYNMTNANNYNIKHKKQLTTVRVQMVPVSVQIRLGSEQIQGSMVVHPRSSKCQQPAFTPRDAQTLPIAPKVDKTVSSPEQRAEAPSPTSHSTPLLRPRSRTSNCKRPPQGPAKLHHPFPT